MNHDLLAPGSEPPSASGSRNRTWLAMAAIALAAIVLAEAWLKFYSYQDDAFIFFRYADNILRGQGAVFNPGQRVEGFSSPLWLGLLVLAGTLGLSPIHAAGILGTAATIATVLLSLRDSRRCGPGLWLAPWALVLFFPFLAWSVSGMDTPLFTMLAWGTISGLRIARAQGKPIGRDVGLCLAAAVLTRPEAAMLLLALVLDEVATAHRQHRQQVRTLRTWVRGFSWLLPALLAGMALLLARVLYYGDLLPNTAYAKVGGSVAHLRLGLRYIGRFLLAAPLVWPAALLLAPRLGRLVPGSVATIVLILLWCLDLLLIGGDHFSYFRFMIPLVPLLFALGASGLHGIWGWLKPTITVPRQRMLGAALGLMCLAAVAMAAPDPAPGRPQHGFDWTLASAKLGQRLAATLPPSTVLALPHIGAVGYYSRLPVLDLLGLVDRDLAHRPHHMPSGEPREFNDIGHECFDIAWSLARRPAVIVPSRTYGSRPFTRLAELRPDFAAEAGLFHYLANHDDYRLVNVPIGDGAFWALFVRRDLDDRLLTDSSRL